MQRHGKGLLTGVLAHLLAWRAKSGQQQILSATTFARTLRQLVVQLKRCPGLLAEIRRFKLRLIIRRRTQERYVLLQVCLVDSQGSGSTPAGSFHGLSAPARRLMPLHEIQRLSEVLA